MLDVTKAFAVSGAIPRHIEGAIGAIMRDSIITTPVGNQRRMTNADILRLITDGFTTVQGLADASGVARQTMQKRVQRLKADGLVVGERVEGQRYNTWVLWLTDAGEKAAKE